MQIFVKPPQGKRIMLYVQASDTISNVKALITMVPGWDLVGCRLRLIFAGNFAGQELEDGRTLSSYNIQPHNILKLAVGGVSGQVHALCDEDELFGEGSFHPLPSVGQAASASSGYIAPTPSSSSSSSSTSSSTTSSSSLDRGKRMDKKKPLLPFKRNRGW
jgi:hypothetical protein